MDNKRSENWPGFKNAKYWCHQTNALPWLAIKFWQSCEVIKAPSVQPALVYFSFNAKPYFIGFVPNEVVLICATSHNKNENRFRALGGHGLSATWYQSQSNSTLVWFFLFFIHKKSFFPLAEKEDFWFIWKQKEEKISLEKIKWTLLSFCLWDSGCMSVCARVCVCVSV